MMMHVWPLYYLIQHYDAASAAFASLNRSTIITPPSVKLGLPSSSRHQRWWRPPERQRGWEGLPPRMQRQYRGEMAPGMDAGSGPVCLTSRKKFWWETSLSLSAPSLTFLTKMSESFGEELQRILQSKQSKNPVFYIYNFHNLNINKAPINTSNHWDHPFGDNLHFRESVIAIGYDALTNPLLLI